MSDTTDQLIAEREKTHGDFAVHAACTQELKATFYRHRNHLTLSHVQREAIEMIFHKLGRIAAGDPNCKDHYDDLAGYARLVSERLS